MNWINQSNSQRIGTCNDASVAWDRKLSHTRRSLGSPHRPPIFSTLTWRIPPAKSDSPGPVRASPPDCPRTSAWYPPHPSAASPSRPPTPHNASRKSVSPRPAPRFYQKWPSFPSAIDEESAGRFPGQSPVRPLWLHIFWWAMWPPLPPTVPTPAGPKTSIISILFQIQISKT